MKDVIYIAFTKEELQEIISGYYGGDIIDVEDMDGQEIKQIILDRII